LELQTPNPLLQPLLGCTGLVEPQTKCVFIVLRSRWVHSQCLCSSKCGWPIYKTTVDLTIPAVRSMQQLLLLNEFGCPINKQMLFNECGCPIYKTHVCFTTMLNDAHKPLQFGTFKAIGQTMP